MTADFVNGNTDGESRSLFDFLLGVSLSNFSINELVTKIANIDDLSSGNDLFNNLF